MEFETPEKDKHLGKKKKIKSMILAFGELLCVCVCVCERVLNSFEIIVLCLFCLFFNTLKAFRRISHTTLVIAI